MPVTRTSGQGRVKGVPNKVPATIREMIVGALNRVGGEDWLAAQAREHPVAFMGLLGRVLPLQLTGQGGAPVAIDFRWADAVQPEPAVIDAEPEPEGDEAVTVTFAEPAP